MESSQRNALIVLAVLAIVIIAVVVWGLARKDPGQGKSGADVANEQSSKGSSSRVGAWLADRGDKVELPKTVYTVPAMAGVVPSRLDVDIPAAPNGEKFRRAKFLLEQGKNAQMVYTDRKESDFRTQALGSPRPDKGQDWQRDDQGRSIGTVMATEKGGTLTLICLDRAPCIFRLVK